MPYVELHCHSAFSFLDGASLPEELVAAALERGHTALALTDHDSVSGSMEFAQAARERGRPAGDPRGRGDVSTAVRRPAPPHAARARRARVGQPLPAAHPRARAHARVRSTRRGARAATLRGSATRTSRVVGDPRVTLDDVEAHAEGLVCLSGCARHGVRDEPTMRRLLRAFGARRASASSCSAPSIATTARSTAAWPRSPTASACPAWRRATSTRTRPRARALQDAFVAIREHTTLDASEPLRRGNHSHVLATPEAMAARFADHPDAVAETERLADTLRFDLTQRPRLPLPAAPRTPRPTATLAERLRTPLRGPLPDRAPQLRSPRPPRAWRRSCASSPGSACRASSSCTATCSSSRARSPSRCAGPTRSRALLPPGRGRGSSVSSIVCYLTGLSHVDPIANKLLLGRFLNEEIIDAARHRPRLPARRARGPHPARARALRPRSLGARRRLPDLPRARRDPRAGQGARAAAGGDRARRARLGGLAGRGRRPRHRHRAGGRARAPTAAGRGWARWPRRRTACPATSPSTPAA